MHFVLLPPLMEANPLQGPLEVGALKIETFLGHEMATSETNLHKFTKISKPRWYDRGVGRAALPEPYS
jgi:hypothetical protein